MFAAYSQSDDSISKSASSPRIDKDCSNTWLVNASFVPASPSSAIEHDSNTEYKQNIEKKKKKAKGKNKRERFEDLVINFHSAVEDHGTKVIKGSTIHSSNGFRLDHNPDKNNLAFPNMYFKNVPRHICMKGCMGNPVDFKFSPKRSKLSRYFRKKYHKILNRPDDSQKEEPKKTERDPLGIYDSSTLSYVQGACVDKSTSKESILKECDSLLTNFNQKLRENPHDVKLWLKFVEYQKSDFVTRAEVSGKNAAKLGFQQKNLHVKALLERKVSILEKAIEHNPKNVELITARMKLLGNFWEINALQNEWRNLLFVNPMSIELWKEHLTSLECSFEGFSVSQVLKAYSHCFQKLIQMQNPSFAVHQRPAHLDELLIDIATRLMLFLRQSGWTEKSISYTQALIELSLQLSDDQNSPVSSLKIRWESNLPRFGEIVSISNNRDVHGLDVLKDEDVLMSSGQSFHLIWKGLESVRSNEHWQACSQSDDCEDEDRFVAFAELSQHLFLCDKKSHLHYRLIVGSLTSLGIPILPACQAQLLWAPHAVDDNLIQCLSSLPQVAHLSSTAPSFLTNGPYLAFLRRVVLQGYRLLEQPFCLELALWWLEVERIRIKTVKNSSNTKSEINQIWKETKGWMKNFLKGIPTSDSVSTIMLYHGYAMVEREIETGDDHKKTLQMLLQMYSSNPLSLNEAQSKEKTALIRVWWSYSRSLLLSRNRQQSSKEALAHLVNLGSGSNFSLNLVDPSPAMVLKAKRKYEALFQGVCQERNFNGYPENVTFHQPDEVVDILGCYCFFLSLTDSCKAAYQMFQAWINGSKTNCDDRFTPENRFNSEFLRYHTRRESVYVYLLEFLLVCRDWVKDYQPKLFHDTLCSALKEYPDSMQLLAILIKSEERCNMFSRLWNNLTLKAKSEGELTNSRSALAACLALASREETIKEGEEKTFNELEGCSYGIPTLHLSYRRKMECLLEHCVSQYPGCHVAVLWRILMRSFHLHGNSAGCKALFYRAIRDCPKSKDIYLDIIEYVPDSLKEVTDLIKEKELRLRLPLEELKVLLEEEKDEEMDEIE